MLALKFCRRAAQFARGVNREVFASPGMMSIQNKYNFRTSATYAETHARSVDPETREQFWDEVAQELTWFTPYDKVLEETGSGRDYRWMWFPGGTMNTAYNCLDRHVEAGRGDTDALIFHSAMQSKTETFTYHELTAKVAKMAGALANQGVVKGDVVLLYMPMIPEAIISMLACARLGAVHNVVFGGFAANQLANRIDDSKPRVIVSASCGLEPNRVVPYKKLLDDAIDISEAKVETCLIVQRSQLPCDLIPGRDFDYEEVNTAAAPHDCVPMKSEDPLYVIYTSGTTGVPKAIQRENGGHMVALHWSMPAIYGCDIGDVFWAASDVGWVVGSSYITYAPLLRGCTTVLYEGKPVGTPDAGVFWRLLAQHKVKAMFCAPTAMRAIKALDPDGDYLKDVDLSHFKALFLAGERSDPATIDWASDLLNVPVIDHWWQTETGWPICSNFLGMDGPFDIKPGSASFPVPGWDVRVVNDTGDGHNTDPLGPNELGQLVVKLPLPPCAFTTLFHDDKRFQESYLDDYPGFYNTADAGHVDEQGYISVMSRTDDIINVAGHRLSTGTMEQVLAKHPAVAECAVIGIHDELKGQLPLGLVVMKSGTKVDPSELSTELVAMVRQQVGAVAAFKSALVVPALPKVKSGKILRKTLKRIFDGDEYVLPGNIEDASVLDVCEEIATDFRQLRNTHSAK
eukprot:m.216071 g.216071  ORF g.216071 m.216071 type:complete len:686 (+) comp33202_c5_seq9:146-2203(+)